MTFTWWLVPIVALGVVMILAPFLGKLWADRDEEQRRWTAAMRRRGWRP
jgi:hypothetical protein